MVEISRRLGSIIMPTNQAIAAARDSVFACLNLSRRFRAFIGRGGVVPPPAIHRSALTASGKDALIGQMAPQPTAKSSLGETPLDRFLGCHQWLALGFGADPAIDAVGQRLCDPRGAGRAVHRSQSTRSNQERANIGPGVQRPQIHRLGREAQRPRYSRSAGPLHRRETRRKRRSCRPHPIRQRDRHVSPKGGLTTASQGGTHVAYADCHERSGQRRTSTQRLAYREGKRSPVRPFRAP